MSLTDCKECPGKHFASLCFKLGRSCYLVFCGLSDWYEARTLCDQFKSRLATVNDSATIQYVREHIQSMQIKCQRYWIGLSSFNWVSVDKLTSGKYAINSN